MKKTKVFVVISLISSGVVLWALLEHDIIGIVTPGNIRDRDTQGIAESKYYWLVIL